MECHGFVCGNRKMAETVTLTVAHTFSTAYEQWRVLPAIKQFEKNAQILIENDIITSNDQQMENPNKSNENDEKLIDFDGPELCSGANFTQNGQTNNLQWVKLNIPNAGDFFIAKLC